MFTACLLVAGGHDKEWELIPQQQTAARLNARRLINCPQRFFAALLDFCEDRANDCSNTAGVIHLSSTLLSKGATRSSASDGGLLPRRSTSVWASTFRHLTHFHIFLFFFYFRHQHPVDNAGFFSFLTLHWLSPLALKAYKASSLSVDDVWGLSCHEASEINCQRWSNCDTAKVCLLKVTRH